MKTCKRCKINKSPVDFYKHSGLLCKQCANKESKDRYHANIETLKESHKKYRDQNKDRIKERAAVYRKKNNHSGYSNNKAKEYKDKITDCYVKVRLRGKGVENDCITPEMIEEQRVLILIERIRNRLSTHGIKVCDGCKQSHDITAFRRKKFHWKGEEKYSYDNLCKRCRDKKTQEYRK